MPDLNALAANDLRRFLTYCPVTGEFRWRERPAGNCRVAVGQIAGSRTSLGYIKIQLLGRRYAAHRLAWLYVTGSWPSKFIDHKDGIGTNNRWSNLREATQSQNMRNSRRPSGSRSGLKGVTFLPKKGLYNARIRDGKKRISLGCFKTAAQAHEAYVAKAKELFGEFARAA